jgi:hypothetical protein
MPDMTIEYMQMCDSMIAVAHVGGYEQTNLFSETGQPRCTCKAYQFAKEPKTCKHIHQAIYEACAWHQQYSDEVQTEEQRENHICPKCGGATQVIRVAV